MQHPTRHFSLAAVRRTLQVTLIALLLVGLRPAGMASNNALQVEVVGQGRALLFVPGLTCSGDVWAESVEALKDSYQCHIFTLPGFAGHPPVDHEGSYVDFIQSELHRYIESQQLHAPVWIGHSLGGFIGLKLASQPDSPLAGLVVVDSLPFLPAMMNPAATEAGMKEAAGHMANQARAMSADQARQMLGTMITAPEHIERALDWSTRSDGATVAKAMTELYTTDLRDDIATIDIPVLVLGAWVGYRDYGSTRASTEAIYRAQYENLAHYDFAMTDIGKHFIMWDDPAFFMEVTTNFLASLSD